MEKQEGGASSPTQQRPPPPAPTAQAFQSSVLDSFQQFSQSDEILRSPEKDSRHETMSQPSFPPPPPLRRSSSTGGGSFVNKNTRNTLMASSQQQFSSMGGKALIRRRSSLFDSLPRRSSMGSLFAVPETNPAPSTTMFQGAEEDVPTHLPDHSEGAPSSRAPADALSESPRRVPKSSLFGAVMEKLGNPATPPKGFRSPSGKSIMDFVNRIASPFRFQSPQKVKRKLSIDDAASHSNGSPTATTPQRKRSRTNSHQMTPNQDSMSSLQDDENWREAPIFSFSDDHTYSDLHQAEILDWTLKRKIQLECHPPEALQRIQLSREWRNALTYWQYRASDKATIPSSTMTADKAVRTYAVSKKSLKTKRSDVKGNRSVDESKMGSSEAVNGNAQDPKLELASQLTKMVRHKKATSAQTPGEDVITNHSEISSDREWREAFRSLFFLWYQSVEENRNSEKRQQLLDHYFYCVADDHVVLFRVDETSDGQCVPRVLLSNSGECFRENLRTAGVGNIVVLKDTVAEGSTAEMPAKQKIMSPTVKADLEALRKAQVYGEVAGADVAIKIKSKKKAIEPEANMFMPISVSGTDSVIAFFEVYFNRLGITGERLKTTVRHLNLPTLICPNQVGPFWHSRLESLHAIPVKGKPNETTSGIVEVTGFVLPSIIRRIVALAASKMLKLQNAQTNDGSMVTRSPSKDNNSNNAMQAGSYYVVLHTMEEDTKGLLALKKIRNNKKSLEQGTLLFNDIGTGDDRDSDSAGSHIMGSSHLAQCRSGTTLQLVVWDISRSTVAACKVGTLSL